jgi:hypothetical protein
MEQLNKDQLVAIMVENLDEKEYKKVDELPPILENDKEWSMADLFIRQFLNNGSDGFGLENVEYVYHDILLPNKELLIREKMVSKNGKNNSGMLLWDNYDF